MRIRIGTFAVVLLVIAATPLWAQGPRFYPDDPLRTEPTPLPVEDVKARSLSEVLEQINNSLKKTGERHPANGVIVARAVNTLGEVMDGDWYVNRHASRRMTIEELQRGAGNSNPPSLTSPLQVLVVKTFGVNPGLLVADSKNELYLMRFDPEGYEGLATGAEMVTSRLFYALGYHVPENYIVRFARAQLVANAEGQAVSSSGRPRGLLTTDIDMFLRKVPAGTDQTYRAVATRLPEARGSLLGPFQIWGTRRDDPNDTVPHEHRRDLRGLSVFEAWVNNANARAVGTQDVLTTVAGVTRIRHYLIDFTRSLGSGILGGPKLSWEGNESAFPGLSEIGRNIAGMGISTPAWMKADYPDLREVGAFEGMTFDPGEWTTNHPIAPFANRLPDDTFWAARQVMAFTDDEIRAIVQTGQYSKEAEDWITAALIERRNRIGRTFFARVLPLDRFRVAANALEFDDLNVRYGFAAPREYTIEWSVFDNANNFLDRLGTGAMFPAAAQSLAPGAYIAARIHAGDPAMQVQAFLRKRSDGFELVGLERTWPGKVVAVPPPPVRADRRVFADLAPLQRTLFETYARAYNESRGSQYTPEQSFDRLTISEQTTFYGITHALLNTRLTDAQGASLGTALDRLESVERIAGQYAGRAGDEQFRLYVTLKPDTRALLEKSREFFRDHENTVYHVGYPHSYRQMGKEPNIQLSMSEDGLRADIDVDYRASKTPQSMFNGHLTSSNSDIRVGENANRHGARWTGLITWWQSFGRLAEALPDQQDLLNLDRPEAPATPLPPDRPAGAAPDRVEDAVQEFLTDWLVRHQYDQALQFLSPRAYACLTLDDEAQGRVLDAANARRELRRIMEYSSGKLGEHANLTSVVVAFTPRDPKRVVLEHAFRREFMLTPLTEAQARPYLCDAGTAAPTGGEYVGAVFQFRTAGGGLFGLLWTREEGKWKLVSYRPLNP
jgi:hypothetical protein